MSSSAAIALVSILSGFATLATVSSAFASSAEQLALLTPKDTNCFYMNVTYALNEQFEVQFDRCSAPVSCTCGENAELYCETCLQRPILHQRQHSTTTTTTTTTPQDFNQYSTTAKQLQSTTTPEPNQLNTQQDVETPLPSTDPQIRDHQTFDSQQKVQQQPCSMMQQGNVFQKFRSIYIDAFYEPILFYGLIAYAIVISVGFFSTTIALAKKSSQAKLPISFPPAYDDQPKFVTIK